MTAKEYQDWVRRLSQYDPAEGAHSPYDRAYREMARAGASVADRLSIHEAARARYEERRRSAEKTARLAMSYGAGIVRDDPYKALTDAITYGNGWYRVGTGRYAAGKAAEMPTYTGHLDDYVNQSRYVKPIDLRPGKMNWLDDKFNTEGEKQMEKIDWHKPLRAFKTPGHEIVDAKVYTYKSGRQRVIWVDERVYPVDDQGRAMADVDYGPNWVNKGAQIVENVPEEKFFVGLRRLPGGGYVLTDGGTTTTMSTMTYWKGLVAGEPHWIVDTRKSAEPPKAIVHDPKDWVALYYAEEDESAAVDDYFVTESEAKRKGAMAVRVRTTPAPVDTSRYIQLYRMNASAPWRINAHGPAAGGSQEFTWGETKNRGANPLQTAVKVRD